MNAHVPHKDDRRKIYHQLSIVMFETDETAFWEKLQQLLSIFFDAYPPFTDYFQKQYAHQYLQWAAFNRAGTLVNTNMLVESFLKVVYLDNKQNRRIDDLMHTLL